ncbi:MAG: ABC transporter ATP-binding protein [Alphaproteobacteria bacterium]|nr:ABC transporter ATP-binding protein [Alphaproteobacteria bacterium]
MSAPPLLEVHDLAVSFSTRAGRVPVLEHVSFTLAKGETVAMVGESGSGKSVTAYAMLRLLDRAGRIDAGRVRFGGADLFALSDAEMADIRGREAAMIFQNPRAALNPTRRVGDQIGDVLRRHGAIPANQIRKRVLDLLDQVKIPDPARRANAYAFELSGGMCQRVMIALALACSPALLIADEPTTGLDVTTQAAVMATIRALAKDRRMATILITHDLALAAEQADRVIVMHAGHVVEDAPTAALFAAPRHPYTRALLRATPRTTGSLADLESIPGSLPTLTAPDLPPCRFAARCPGATAVCRSEPLPRHRGDGRLVACHHPLEGAP